MILDDLDNAAAYAGLHSGLARGFDFLCATDLHALAVGRHEIDGSRLFALVSQDQGRGHAGARLEAHRQYLDIQLSLDGREEIGWQPLGTCREPATPYDEARDILFYADRPTTWLPLAVRQFMIFFPHDAHAPLAGQGPLHKVVVKVAVDDR